MGVDFDSIYITLPLSDLFLKLIHKKFVNFKNSFYLCSMKDERITLETAKLLKEKKFEIGGHGYYVEYHKTHNSDNPSFAMKKGEVELDTSFYFINNNTSCDNSNPNYTMFAAPTQSLVQKWLREVHNVHIGLDYDIHGWMFFITYIPNPSGEVNWSNDNYNTYEEALEMGFKIAFRDYVK